MNTVSENDYKEETVRKTLWQLLVINCQSHCCLYPQNSFEVIAFLLFCELFKVCNAGTTPFFLLIYLYLCTIDVSTPPTISPSADAAIFPEESLWAVMGSDRCACMTPPHRCFSFNFNESYWDLVTALVLLFLTNRVLSSLLYLFFRSKANKA